MTDNFFQKAIYMGIGLANFSKAKIEEFATEFSEKSQMSKEEGKKWIDELIAESEKAKAKIDEEVKNRVDEMLRKMDVARKEDLDRLELRIKNLEIKASLHNNA